MTEFTVTGIRYQFPMELSQEVRTQMAEKYVTSLEKGTPVVLVAEPENPMDAQAIAVYIDYERIGYIDKEETAQVHPLLDENQQCDALVERNDGHITLFVTIPGATVKPHVMNSRDRVLPASPLGQEVKTPFTKAENTLQVVACRLMRIEPKKENLQEFLKLAEHYVPLMKISICNDENVWRNTIMKKLSKASAQSKDWGLTKEQTQALTDMYKKVRACVGDMHRTSDHWPERVFKQHLQTVKADKEITDHLYQKYCKTFLDGKDFNEADKNRVRLELGRLRLWLENMPCSELRNPNDLDAMALRVNYMHLSRTEIYDLFSVLLLIEKLDEVSDGRTFDEEEVIQKLLHIFCGKRENAQAFLKDILGLKPTQITELVNQLVSERTISEISKKRDLWQVLHEYNIYPKSESNWNSQVK